MISFDLFLFFKALPFYIDFKDTLMQIQKYVDIQCMVFFWK